MTSKCYAGRYSGLFEAEEGFQRIKVYRELPVSAEPLSKGYVRKNLLQCKQPKPCEKGRQENLRGLGHPQPRRIQRRPPTSGLLSASVSDNSFAPNARWSRGSPHRRSFTLKHLCSQSIGIPCSQFNRPHLHPLSGLLPRLRPMALSRV